MQESAAKVAELGWPFIFWGLHTGLSVAWLLCVVPAIRDRVQKAEEEAAKLAARVAKLEQRR